MGLKNLDKSAEQKGSGIVTLWQFVKFIFTVALICFSAWLAPTIQGWLICLILSARLAANISTMACSAIQFFIYFPVDKILFHKKKEEKEEK